MSTIFVVICDNELNETTRMVAWYENEGNANHAVFCITQLTERFRKKCETVGAITKTGFIDPSHVHYPLIEQWYVAEMRKFDAGFDWPGANKYSVIAVVKGYLP